MTIAVVGAGITGLTVAHTLLREHPGTRVVVLEASDRCGGKIRTSPFAGLPVDWGADAFLARVPEAVELCRELGLEGELVTPATGRAYVWAGGAMHPFPEGVVLGVPTDLDALAASGVVTAAGVERARQDLSMPAESLEGDASVGEVVRRRVGDEVFEKLVGPLLAGVNAGDADELSIEAGAPQLAAALRGGSSLIEGLRAQRAAAAAIDAPVFYGLRGGTQTLTDALVRSITDAGGSIRFTTPATSLTRSSAGYVIETGDGPVEADAVALTAPAPATARLLEPIDPDVAGELAQLEYASVALVALAFDTDQIGRPLDGSGFLVAEGEGLLLTACSWASSKWAHLAEGGRVVLRASAGRHHDRRALELDDGALVAALLDDLATTMSVTGEPAEVRVTRWIDALPQFRPGHLDRVARWRARLAEAAPGLQVGGAAFDGLGIPVCVRQGRQLAAQLRRPASET